MIKDRNIAFQVKREFITVYEMLGRTAAMVASLGAGAAVFQEALAAAQIAGLAINEAGDSIHHLWKIPWDLDRDQPLQARIWFSHTEAVADTPDWLISLKGLAAGAAISAAQTTPDEALTFPALANTAVANALDKTSWQSTGANAAIAATDHFVQMAVECNGLGSAGADEITLYGVELAYALKMTGVKRELTDVALGTLY